MAPRMTLPVTSSQGSHNNYGENSQPEAEEYVYLQTTEKKRTARAAQGVEYDAYNKDDTYNRALGY